MDRGLKRNASLVDKLNKIHKVFLGQKNPKSFKSGS